MKKVNCVLLVYIRINVLSHIVVLGHRQQRVAADTRKTALIECVDLHLKSFVFPRHLFGVFVGIEGVHQDERNVGVVCFVETL